MVIGVLIPACEYEIAVTPAESRPTPFTVPLPAVSGLGRIVGNENCCDFCCQRARPQFAVPAPPIEFMVGVAAVCEAYPSRGTNPPAVACLRRRKTVVSLSSDIAAMEKRAEPVNCCENATVFGKQIWRKPVCSMRERRAFS